MYVRYYMYHKYVFSFRFAYLYKKEYQVLPIFVVSCVCGSGICLSACVRFRHLSLGVRAGQAFVFRCATDSKHKNTYIYIYIYIYLYGRHINIYIYIYIYILCFVFLSSWGHERCCVVFAAVWFLLLCGFRCWVVFAAVWFSLLCGFRCWVVFAAVWFSLPGGFRCCVVKITHVSRRPH